MAFNHDETNPTDVYSIPSYPSNARAYRAMMKALITVEHDPAEGRHKFGFGTTAVRDAITTWVNGSIFFNSELSSFGFVPQIRAGGLWLNVYPDSNYANITAANVWAGGQYVTPVSVTPGAGSPNTLAVSAATSSYKYATISADTILSNPVSYTSGKATSIDFEITQNGTGGYALTFGSSYRFPGGVAPTIAQGAGEKTLLNLRWMVGDVWLVTIAADVSA